MQTPIIKISEDKNTITHESGIIVEFVKVPINSFNGCNGCCYMIKDNKCTQLTNDDVICFRRTESGIFKIKTNAPNKDKAV